MLFMACSIKQLNWASSSHCFLSRAGHRAVGVDAPFHIGQSLVVHHGDFDMQIDAIQKQTADALAVFCTMGLPNRQARLLSPK